MAKKNIICGLCVSCMIILAACTNGKDTADTSLATEDFTWETYIRETDIATENSEETELESEQETMESEILEERWEISGPYEWVHSFSNGAAWVCDSLQWMCIDTKGEILFVLKPNYEPVTDFINGFAIIQTENDKEETVQILIDKSGEDVLHDFIEKNQDSTYQLLTIGENRDDIDVWFLVTTDTYQEHTETVCALNGFKGRGTEFGEVDIRTISVWDERDVLLKGVKEGWAEVEALGEGMYRIRNSMINSSKYGVYNTENNESFSMASSGIEPLQWYQPYWGRLGYNDGILCTKHELLDTSGKPISGNANAITSYLDIGSYSEGVFVAGENTDRGFVCNGFYDLEGNLVIDLSGYTTETYPFFKNGYCVLNLVNDGNVDYFTILDKNGTQLFEPQKGEAKGDHNSGIASYVTEGVIVVYDYDKEEYRYVDINGNTVLEEYRLSADWNGNGAMGKFYDGIARTSSEWNNCFYIDREGNRLEMNKVGVKDAVMAPH